MKVSTLFISSRTCFLPVLIFLFPGLFYGCTGDESSATEMIVPIEEKIPHFDRDHIPIDRSHSFEELEERPAELDLLYQYLKAPDGIDMVQLDLMFSGPGFGFGVEAVRPDRLLILDGDRSHLIEYDLNTHQTHSIAEHGSGPGDIQYPRDMILEDMFLYIAREDMYVIRFDCSSTPCEPDEALSLDVKPVSISLSGDQFAVLGIPDPQGEEPHPHPIQAINMQGEQINQFGDAYEAGMHRIISFQFGMSGNVRYSPSTGQYVLTYGAFPYLYVYDDATLELQETYELSNFTLPQFTYFPDERSIRMPTNDHQQIRNIRVTGQNLLLIEMTTLQNFRPEMPPWDFRHDFYVVDPESQNSFYMGGYERLHQSPGQEVFVTGQGLAIYDYDEDHLYWAGISNP